MKNKLFILPLLILVFLSNIGHVSAQNYIQVPFASGFIGDADGNNKSINSVTLFSLGWTRAFFSQNSPTNVFVAQGNDIIGEISIEYQGILYTFPGFVKWRAPSGTVTSMVFQPGTGVNLTIPTSSGSYTITPSKYVGLIFNGKTLSISGGEVTGNAATSGLLTELNDYLALVRINDPNGPVTVNALTTVSTTPTITGSVTLASEETFSVQVNGRTYTTGAGSALTISGTTWSLAVPDPIPAGTYNVVAVITNSSGYTLTDVTTNELNIISVSTSESTITASPNQILANGTSTSTITVQLKDSSGNNITISGGPVTMSSTFGTLSGVTDIGNGTYTATLTSSNTAQTAVISFAINGVSATQTASVAFEAVVQSTNLEVSNIDINEGSNWGVFTVNGPVGDVFALRLLQQSGLGKASLGNAPTIQSWNGSTWVNYNTDDQLTIPAGGTVNVRVDITNEQDNIFEGSETFQLEVISIPNDVAGLPIYDANFQTFNLDSYTRIGTEGAVGTTYKKVNAITINGQPIDVQIKIDARSNVTSFTFDDNSSNASRFQPEINSSSSSGSFVDFTFEFFLSGSSTKVGVKNFVVNPVDVDGISSSNKEFVELFGLSSYQLGQGSGLTVIQNPAGRTGFTRFEGINTSLSGVTFDNTASFIAYYTAPVDKFKVRMGVTGSSSSVRLFSMSIGSAIGTFTQPTNNSVAQILGTATIQDDGTGAYWIGNNRIAATNTELNAANIVLDDDRQPAASINLNAAGISVSPIASSVYSGLAITPSVTVTDGGVTLVLGTDYTVTYSANKNAGTATVTITGIGNYSGTRTVTFAITPAPLTVTAQNANKVFGASDPTLTVSFTGLVNGEAASVLTGTLSVTREPGESVGTYAITASGLTSSNYNIAFAPGTFTVTAKGIDAAGISVSPISPSVYSGQAITPSVTVTDGGVTLVLGTDYMVTYSDNKNAGTATVTITGIGNYSGTREVTFAITPAPLTVTAQNANKVFGASDPALTVSYTGLVNGEAASVLTGTLSVTREPGESVGTYAITASGLTSINYNISFAPGTFTITAKSLDDDAIEIAAIGPLVYNAQNQTPLPVIKDGNKTLVPGVDYMIVYSNNKNAGTATISIQGVGNYSGTQLLSFQIVPKTLVVNAVPGQSKEWLSADPTFIFTLEEPIYEGDSLTGVLKREAGEDVGTYAILVGSLDAGSNYVIQFKSELFSIVDTRKPAIDLNGGGTGESKKNPLTGESYLEFTLSEGTQLIGTFKADEGVVWSLEEYNSSDVLDLFELVINPDGSVSVRFKSPSRPGTYEVYLCATDPSGNKSCTLITVIVKDETIPALEASIGGIIKDPTDNSLSTNITLPEGEKKVQTFSADEFVIWTLEASGQKDDKELFKMIVNGDGSVSVEFKENARPGDYEVNLCATDQSGNRSCINIRIKVVADVIYVMPTEWIILDWGSNRAIPNRQEVVTSDGFKFDVEVELDQSPLNRFARGEYYLTGELLLPDFLNNTAALKADVRVRVLPKPAPLDILLSNNTFEGLKTGAEVFVGTISVVDPVDDIHWLGLPYGMEDNKYFRVEGNSLYWSSEDPAAGRIEFRIVVRVTDRDNNTLDKVFVVSRLRKRIEDIEVYNTFTPEGDGINDNWGVPEVRYYEGARIQVFERSGKRVFYTEDADVRWDGTFNGKEMPVGSYFWVLEVRETGTVRKGIVNLLRK